MSSSKPSSTAVNNLPPFPTLSPYCHQSPLTPSELSTITSGMTKSQKTFVQTLIIQNGALQTLVSDLTSAPTSSSYGTKEKLAFLKARNEHLEGVARHQGVQITRIGRMFEHILGEGGVVDMLKKLIGEVEGFLRPLGVERWEEGGDWVHYLDGLQARGREYLSRCSEEGSYAGVGAMGGWGGMRRSLREVVKDAWGEGDEEGCEEGNVAKGEVVKGEEDDDEDHDEDHDEDFDVTIDLGSCHEGEGGTLDDTIVV